MTITVIIQLPGSDSGGTGESEDPVVITPADTGGFVDVVRMASDSTIGSLQIAPDCTDSGSSEEAAAVIGSDSTGPGASS